MASFTTATDTIKELISSNWNLSSVDYSIYTKQEQNGKAINKRGDNEIILGREDYNIDAMDLFKNFYDKDYTVIVKIRSTSVSEGEQIFDEVIRILGENTSNKDIPHDWGTTSFDTVDIDTPKFNEFDSTISVTLKRTGDDP